MSASFTVRSGWSTTGLPNLMAVLPGVKCPIAQALANRLVDHVLAERSAEFIDERSDAGHLVPHGLKGENESVRDRVRDVRNPDGGLERNVIVASRGRRARLNGSAGFV
jgi:hypothetical protein